MVNGSKSPAQPARKAPPALREPPSCAVCPVRALALYHDPGDDSVDAITAMRKASRRIAKRTVFVWENEICEEFFTVQEGWAYCYRMAPDGARQIVDFLLPGDAVSLAALYRNRLYFSVRALTDVALCVFDSAAMSDFLHARPTLARRLEEFWLRESYVLSNRLLDLGRRSGPQRVARLILDLHHRWKLRGGVADGAFPFPLRHQHIADASGLTAVHVSRIMSAFRAQRVLEMNHDVIAIRDVKALNDLAQVTPAEEGYSTVA